MKPLACFTITRNEAFFLPLWLRHYGATGGSLFVLDHESDDGSTSRPDEVPFPLNMANCGTPLARWSNTKPYFVRVPVFRPDTDDVGWMLKTVESIQRELLLDFERVLFAEVDEFLIPDPERYTDLASYLDRVGGDRITATGYDVCQHDYAIGELAGMPSLRGRWWKRNDRYDKTLISSVPVHWEVGFHRPVTGEKRPAADPALLLVHLHYMDREIAWDRLCSRMAGRQPAPGDWGRQNKFTKREDFDRDFSDAISGAEPIPERYWSCL